MARVATNPAHAVRGPKHAVKTGQTTVLAFILGNGLCNMVTPTSGMLLAYIAASKVGYGEWIRFIAPLFAVMLVIGAAALGVAVATGY